MRQEWQMIANQCSDEELIKAAEELGHGDGPPFLHHFYMATGDTNLSSDFLAQALAERLKAYKENNYNPQLP